MSPLESQLSVVKLYCDRGDFFDAIPSLKQLAHQAIEEKNFSIFLDAQNLLLRCYAETEQNDEVNKAKEAIHDLVLKENFELNSKTYYTLALCAAYKGQADSALEYLQRALQMALASDNKEDICKSIFGIARVYAMSGVERYTDALKEIYNLQVFFQVYDFPEIKASAAVLNAEILRALGKYDEALDTAWKAYDLVKITKNLTSGTYLLAFLGQVYFEAGDKDMARLYITLAHKSVDPKNMKRVAHMISYYHEKLGIEADSNFDLMFDEENHAVVERKLGKIDFKNQFILLDLLRLFVQNQGTVYSKEYLVENVWKQTYDPSVHDNKIYVTIKRLRKMIEPDYDKPKYIFRAKNGYYMNKAARVSRLPN